MLLRDSIGLPEPIKRAIEHQESSHNPDSDISCTTLIDAPLRFWLRKKYYQYVVEEYSDRLWALYGSIAHMIAEKFALAANMQYVERTAVALVNGWRVSAQSDYILGQEAIWDYKFTSVWATLEGVKSEWINQLNVGLWLLRNDIDPLGRYLGTGVKKLYICALYRDWVPTVQDKCPNKVQVLEVPIWPDKFAGEYVAGRVALHQSAVADLNVAPPICTDSERWIRDYAVMKDGRKNALKAGIATKEEAEVLMKQLGGDWVRPAQPRRCMEYCVYGKQGFCPYWDNKDRCRRQEPVIAPIPRQGVAEDPDHRRKDGPNV